MAIQDGHGDVTGLVSPAGELVLDYAYDPFGNETTAQTSYAATWDNPFRYCGEYWDGETQTYYLRARQYDPAAGRFLSEDPAQDGLNWYIYCYNNPVRYWDPSGYITQEEIDMYENGEMAPMAYSYLMNLTYQWYLADTEEDRELFHQWAEEFRATGYTTTNGFFTSVDEGIAYMPSIPTETLSQEQHFYRNKLNLRIQWNDYLKLQERLPDHLQWRELKKFRENGFHRIERFDNRKYVSACEHFELVYTSENELVDERFSPMDMGTYNYYGLTQADKHTKVDVVPWIKWGNTPKGWIWSSWVK